MALTQIGGFGGAAAGGTQDLSDVTGTLALANGGTGQTSAAAALAALGGIAAAIVDAKGDIITGTAADTVARLAVGSNLQVLTADSSAAGGMGWKNNVIVKYKTADEDVTSSTNVQADDNLVFSIGASETWAFLLVLRLDCTAAATSPGYKESWSLPAGATGVWNLYSDQSAANIIAADMTTTNSFSLAFASESGSTLWTSFLLGWGYVVNSTNAGTVQYNFAQVISSSNPSTHKKGSTLIAWRVA